MLNVRRWGASSKARCLVVLCHGVGADAEQMGLLAEGWAPALPGVAFLAPDGPEPFDQFPSGRQWFSLRDRTPSVLEEGASRAAPLLDATIDAECARLGLEMAQVALAGFSQGAMMVLHQGLRRRPSPAAILAYSGALLDTPDLAASLSGRPPVLLVHGESDDVVPFARGPEAAAALQRLGLSIETCWRPHVGHFVDKVGLTTGMAFLERTVFEASPQSVS